VHADVRVSFNGGTVSPTANYSQSSSFVNSNTGSSITNYKERINFIRVRLLSLCLKQLFLLAALTAASYTQYSVLQIIRLFNTRQFD